MPVGSISSHSWSFFLLVFKTLLKCWTSENESCGHPQAGVLLCDARARSFIPFILLKSVKYIAFVDLHMREVTKILWAVWGAYFALCSPAKWLDTPSSWRSPHLTQTGWLCPHHSKLHRKDWPLLFILSTFTFIPTKHDSILIA